MAIDLAKKSEGTGSVAGKGGQAAFRGLGGRRFLGREVGHKEMLFFFSQLSLMLEVATSLNDALRVAGNQVKGKAFAAVIGEMVEDIEDGRPFSQALARHPKIFRPVWVSMVHAGETGGFLKEIIDRIVEMQEKHQVLVAQVRRAVAYPLILALLGVGVVVFLLMGVIPKFLMIFQGKEHLLPGTTRWLIGLSDFLRSEWPVCVAGLGVAGVTVWSLSGMEFVRTLADRFLVQAPLVSRLSNKIYTSQLVRILGSLMASKVPLLEALNVTETVFGNRFYRQFVASIHDHVEQGGSFAHQFGSNPHVLESVTQMVSVAEGAGNLPVVMLRLADFFEDEARQDLQALPALIEPLSLVVMGGVVGGIVASVVLPMFRIAGVLQ